MKPISFPVGFHQLHHDISMNFQMNRWFSWVGEEGMLEEMREAAGRIANYAHWKREFLTLAEKASDEGHLLRAGFYFRSADFFMRCDDPDRKIARAKFRSAMRSVYRLDQHERHAIPYAAGDVAGFLPALDGMQSQVPATSALSRMPPRKKTFVAVSTPPPTES